MRNTARSVRALGVRGGLRVGGPFDLIVSAIAIHNLRDRNAIADCYRGIARLLKPGAVFLDYDLFEQSGGIETNIGWMRDAGMTRVSRAWVRKSRLAP